MDPSRNMSKYRNLLNGEHGEPPLVSTAFRTFDLSKSLSCPLEGKEPGNKFALALAQCKRRVTFVMEVTVLILLLKGNLLPISF